VLVFVLEKLFLNTSIALHDCSNIFDILMYSNIYVVVNKSREPTMFISNAETTQNATLRTYAM
jgi:hypothetical protein